MLLQHDGTQILRPRHVYVLTCIYSQVYSISLTCTHQGSHLEFALPACPSISYTAYALS
jgi:hypothetical protein